jgi:competence protein CoiA
MISGFLFFKSRGNKSRNRELIYETKRRFCNLLTALMNNGQRICLADRWEKEKLHSLREQDSFYCPYCHDRVIMKLGDKKIFHFAHLKNRLCEFEHERESEFHLNGKLQLYQWLNTQKVNPILEYFDSSIKQRADILFFIGKKRYALEFQCSTINENIFHKRNSGYISSGYHPLWILGANQLKRKNSYLTSFSDFHFLFLQKISSNIWMIPFYCSQTKKFILHQSIQPISIRNAFSDQKIENLDKMVINQLLSPPSGSTIKPELWIKELSKWKDKIIRHPGAYQNPFLRELYQSHLNLLLLPPYVGLPIPNSTEIMTPPLIWQTYLFMDVFFKSEINSPISFHDIYKTFKRRVIQNQIQLRKLPLIKEDQTTLIIYRYLHLLVKVNMLKRVNDNTFMLNKRIYIPKTLMEQKIAEEFFYKTFTKFIF